MTKAKEGKPKQPVLVVDDDKSVHELLSLAFQRIGHQVHAVENSYLGRKWLATHSPALIMVDLMMPDGNGFEFCRWVRSQERLQGIRIVVLSSLSDEATVQDALELGAVNFIQKPITMDVFNEKITHILNA